MVYQPLVAVHKAEKWGDALRTAGFPNQGTFIFNNLGPSAPPDWPRAHHDVFTIEV
jgi:hypothetical protein